MEKVVIEVGTRAELDAALNEAQAALMAAAITKRMGIRVARLSAGRYLAVLSDAVPYGTTQEGWS
ncbi:hypothetical protein [Paenarthrobacter sp. NPDC089316]|uniref:hypothetical protein n=1 Tax=unclassified Paenarthrobacter TaxID=2634190 RepID=UPI003432920B